MTRMERMKGQRQLLSLWAWRERLCAEMPIKAVAVDVLFFLFLPSFLFLPPWLLGEAVAKRDPAEDDNFSPA